MMTHLGAPPRPSPCPNLPAGWRNVYWAELKKRLVVSIRVCKHRFLKASSVLSSPAPRMLYIQSILEKSLGEHCVYYSRTTQQMGGGWSPLGLDSQQSGGPFWCLSNQSIKREIKAVSLENLSFLVPAVASGYPSSTAELSKNTFSEAHQKAFSFPLRLYACVLSLKLLEKGRSMLPVWLKTVSMVLGWGRMQAILEIW